MPETTIMLLILSWKMGAAKFGEVSKEVCAVRARNESAPPQTRAKPCSPPVSVAVLSPDAPHPLFAAKHSYSP
jgi:hypothetical protein